VLSVLVDGVSERFGTHRPFIPEPDALLGPPLGLLHPRRSRTKVMGAAPPPSLTLTGGLDALSHPYA